MKAFFLYSYMKSQNLKNATLFKINFVDMVLTCTVNCEVFGLYTSRGNAITPLEIVQTQMFPLPPSLFWVPEMTQ